MTNISESGIQLGIHTQEPGNGRLKPLVTPDIKTFQFGEWRTQYTDIPRFLPERAREQSLQLVRAWANVFPKEDTWVQREVGVPSLIVRLDTTIEGEDLRPFEVEERPAGIGVTSQINPDFNEGLQRVKSTWPDFTVIVSPQRRGSDDVLWARVSDRPLNGEHVLVRAEPEEEEFHELEGRSISSVKSKGDKSYGERLGMWIKAEDESDLPWDESFVLKPLVGSKTKDVFFWVTPDRKKGLSTSQSKLQSQDRIKREFGQVRERDGGMYCQPFYEPEESGFAPVESANGKVDSFRFLIYRVYAGYNLSTKEWEYLGGLWNARSSLKIHGAGDSLFGPAK